MSSINNNSVDEAKRKKKQLEDKIRSLLVIYEEQTGTSVGSIHITKLYSGKSQSFVENVEIEIKL